MLALTKKTDYAPVALSHLARRLESVVSAREIAEDSGVLLPILTNILKTLTNTGIALSTRGAYGGYGSAKPMELISLYRLVTSIEGTFHPVQCVTGTTESSKGPCELVPSCPIREPARRIRGRMKEFLKRVSLVELLGEN